MKSHLVHPGCLGRIAEQRAKGSIRGCGTDCSSAFPAY